ncbi:MAG TPA: chorismate synthase [Candidatus Poseidoniales archaeon]|nr:MAG TPA: chorismate synthase [Candidatus Poseidoniales archaeon]
MLKVGVLVQNKKRGEPHSSGQISDPFTPFFDLASMATVEEQGVEGGVSSMRMRLGEQLAVTLFGTSHGPCVGALIEGMPSGISIDRTAIQTSMDARRPGAGLGSKRQESDEVRLASGIHNEQTTGQPVLIEIANADARSSDYSFLPDRPRPAHQDLPMHVRSHGHADLSGGGSSSARLTAGLVAAAAIVRPLLDGLGVQVTAHVGAMGPHEAPLPAHGRTWPTASAAMARCQDADAAEAMVNHVESLKRERDSVGSRVDMVISGLPMGLGEPWFDGLEPALGRALLAVPGARAVEFGQGTAALRVKGTAHHGGWHPTEDGPELRTDISEGALGGMASEADLVVRLTLKPPSSIPQPMPTVELSTGEASSVTVKGRHDPVLGPRGVAVVEAMAVVVLTDLALRGGYIDG